MKDLVALLEEGRRRERGQSLFYRLLAGDAEVAGNVAAAERLNELLADEQHHVSRLTARILEVGARPADGMAETPDIPSLDEWEAVARPREEDEVRWYTEALQGVDDAPTKSILREILDSELHHRDELAGKWMPAAQTGPEEDV